MEANAGQQTPAAFAEKLMIFIWSIVSLRIGSGSARVRAALVHIRNAELLFYNYFILKRSYKMYWANIPSSYNRRYQINVVYL